MEGCSEGITNELIDTPWLLVAANVKEDLLLTFQHMKREMEEADMGQLSDRLQLNSTVSCKCTIAEDYNKIELYKDEEINGIKDLIGSAILDSEVQGGLRVEMAHWQGFFRSSAGEVTQEIILKMSGIISEFRKQTMDDEDLMFEMLENNLKLIWDLCLLDGSCHAPSLHPGRDRHLETIAGPRRTLGLAFLTQRKLNSTE
ncbi:hypothetical protein KY285_020479 [Solanum tuberosum]|nr:hypothetical protein KY285_020479 [Solanum tuberosum]